MIDARYSRRYIREAPLFAAYLFIGVRKPPMPAGG
jgi:hypothetical protein